jgi:hypothetical protein
MGKGRIAFVTPYKTRARVKGHRGPNVTLIKVALSAASTTDTSSSLESSKPSSARADMIGSLSLLIGASEFDGEGVWVKHMAKYAISKSQTPSQNDAVRGRVPLSQIKFCESLQCLPNGYSDTSYYRAVCGRSIVLSLYGAFSMKFMLVGNQLTPAIVSI